MDKVSIYGSPGSMTLEALGGQLDINHNIPPLDPQSLIHIPFYKRHFSSSWSCQSPNSFSIAEKSKSQVSSKIQGKLSTVSPCTIEKLNISNIQRHKINITIPKVANNRVIQNTGTNTSPKSSGVNIKSHSSNWSIQNSLH